jgi:hypothetical protein
MNARLKWSTPEALIIPASESFERVMSTYGANSAGVAPDPSSPPAAAVVTSTPAPAGETLPAASIARTVKLWTLAGSRPVTRAEVPVAVATWLEPS